MRVLVYGLNAELEAVRAQLRGRFTDEDRVAYREKSAWKANELERADLILITGSDAHAARVREGCEAAGLRVQGLEAFLALDRGMAARAALHEVDAARDEIAALADPEVPTKPRRSRSAKV